MYSGSAAPPATASPQRTMPMAGMSPRTRLHNGPKGEGEEGGTASPPREILPHSREPGAEGKADRPRALPSSPSPRRCRTHFPTHGGCHPGSDCAAHNWRAHTIARSSKGHRTAQQQQNRVQVRHRPSQFPPGCIHSYRTPLPLPLSAQTAPRGAAGRTSICLFLCLLFYLAHCFFPPLSAPFVCSLPCASACALCLPPPAQRHRRKRSFHIPRRTHRGILCGAQFTLRQYLSAAKGART